MSITLFKIFLNSCMFILLYALKNQPLPLPTPQCFWKPIWSLGAPEIKWEVSICTFPQRESPSFHQMCKGTMSPKGAPGLQVSVMGCLGGAQRSLGSSLLSCIFTGSALQLSTSFTSTIVPAIPCPPQSNPPCCSRAIILQHRPISRPSVD